MKFLEPHKVLQHFKILPGMRVVEMHAGSGHFTPLVKESVGKYGVVHSFQHDPRLDMEVPDPADRVLIINLVHDRHHHALFSKAYTLLKPHGKIIFIEKNTSHITPEQATHLAGMAGFIREKHFHAGDHHFGLVFKRI